MSIGNWKGSKIIKDGLTIYIDPSSPNSFLNKNSTVIKDISGNNYHSTVNNNPTYTTSGNGSLKFNGTNNSITMPTHPQLNQMTLSIWLKVNSGDSFGTIIGDSSQSNTVGYLWIYGSGLNSIQWQFATSTVRGTYNDFTILTGAYDNWVNLVFTANYTDSNATILSMYKNATLSSTFTYNDMKIPVERIRRIGSYSGANFMSQAYFGNYLEYNRVLTQAEITQNFNAQRGRYGI